MKGVKGRFLKRFRSIPSSYTSKQHVAPLCTESHQTLSHDHSTLQSPSNSLGKQEMEESNLCARRKNEEIDVFEECECEFHDSMPEMEDSSSLSSSSSSSSFSSSTSFPISPRSEVDEEIPREVAKDLLEFENKCPPGGCDKVILYTTSLRGIRKTFEDCHTIRFLLESFRVVYYERDVSMHLEFKDELWDVLGDRIIPPRLFIKGRHIGGADEVVSLNERGILKKLLKGLPLLSSHFDRKCGWCGGVRFTLCSECNGSRKIFFKCDESNGGTFFGRCTKCNENGLVKCLSCCG